MEKEGLECWKQRLPAFKLDGQYPISWESSGAFFFLLGFALPLCQWVMAAVNSDSVDGSADVSGTYL